MNFRMLAVAAVVGCGLLLPGCVPPADVVVPVETADAQPVFASDEEALAAAVEAFRSYSEATARVSQQGGEEPEIVKPFVTDELFQRELEAFDELRRLDIRLIGSVDYSPHTLQQQWIEDDGRAHVIAYFCADSTGYQVVKAGSQPYRPESVPEAYVVEVGFVSEVSGSSKLLVEEVGEWKSPDGC